MACATLRYQTICYNLPNDLGVNSMLQINKNYVLDQNQKPIAVQIPITEFEQIEEILENYGLAKLMEEVETDQVLSKNEAIQYLQMLKNRNVESLTI
ncbi:hypothetical protein MEO40_13825 [Dolichospermum sp. ST_sed1]|nr:hypothetical protein [Dolichospermum sp. ST_sed1]